MDIASINAEDMAALTAKGYTDADLGMLADTEVKALLIDDTKDGSEATGHDDALAAQDAATKTAQAQEGAAGEKEDDEAGGDEAPAQATPVVQFKAEVPADAAEQIKTLKTEERDAFKSLMEGTMDAEAYQAIRERVEESVDKLKTQALTASIFEQANAQTAEQVARSAWESAEATAFKGFKDEGLDYKAKPALLAAYNSHLKALGNDPKNEKRDAPWFLAEAHRLTKADLGFAAPAQHAPANKLVSGVDLSEVPPTLRTAPTAGGPNINTDEFAHMRNLEGLALERAHAALTDAQRDRYMAE